MYMFDSYTKSGSDLVTYLSEAEMIDNGTVYEKVDFADLQILNLLKRLKEKILFHVIEPDGYSFSDNGHFCIHKTSSIRIENLNPIGKVLIEEMLHTSKTLFYFPGGTKAFYFLGDTIYKTLSARQTGLGGKFLKTPCFERNLALMKQLEFDPFYANALIRTDGKYKKIFAIYKGKCHRTPFALPGRAAKMLTDGSIKFWNIDQKKAEIYLELERKHNDSMIPGILFRTSDTGYHSTVMILTWRHPSCRPEQYYIQETVPISELQETEEELRNLIRTGRRKLEVFRIRMEHASEENATIFDSSSIIKKCRITNEIGIKGKANLLSTIEANRCKNNNDVLEVVLRWPVTGPAMPVSTVENYRNVLANYVEAS